jgi:NAD(P)-dependent dehydrogenase (short-subunit alcohol dehydrogenase family)
LGKAYATLLASRGARIALNNRSSANALQTVAEINASGGEAVAIIGDLGDADAARDCVAQAISAFGGIDILINNAGGVARPAPFAELTTADRDATLRQNLISSWDVTLAAWPHIVERRGRIVFTTSPSMYGTERAPHYGAAKAAVTALMRSLAIDGRARGVHVNAISPVAFTPAADELAGDDEQRALYAAKFPSETVAAVVAWLSHDSCSLNGDTLSVAGPRAALAFMGETAGYVGAKPDFTPEAVAAQLDAIVRTEGYAIYRSADEVLTDMALKVS